MKLLYFILFMIIIVIIWFCLWLLEIYHQRNKPFFHNRRMKRRQKNKEDKGKNRYDNIIKVTGIILEYDTPDRHNDIFKKGSISKKKYKKV